MSHNAIAGDLLKVSEISEIAGTLPIKYQLTSSPRLPLAKDVDGFEFKGTPYGRRLGLAAGSTWQCSGVSPEAQYVGSSEGVRYYRLVSLTRLAMPTKPVRGNRGSNRKHLPTEETRGLVKGCVACGASQESICSLLGGIALPTLYKYYREELDTAVVLANATMAQALFDNGVKSNNVTAQIFWLKARAGWAEAQPAGEDQDRELTIRIVGGLPE